MNKLREQELSNSIRQKITEILEILRDSTFSNKDSRAEFASLIVQLALSTDPRARKAIKKLGDYFTELGHELLGTNQKIEPISAPSSKDSALYKSIFK